VHSKGWKSPRVCARSGLEAPPNPALLLGTASATLFVRLAVDGTVVEQCEIVVDHMSGAAAGWG
jgi:hypothetical protein